MLICGVKKFPVGDAVIRYLNRQLTVSMSIFSKVRRRSFLFRGSLPDGKSNFEARLANIGISGINVIQSQNIPIDGRLNGQILFSLENRTISPSGTLKLS